jgi:hypothetical protein
MNLGFSLGLGAPRRAVSSGWTPPGSCVRWFDGRTLGATWPVAGLPDSSGAGLPQYATLTDGNAPLIAGGDVGGRWVYTDRTTSRRIEAAGYTDTANTHIFGLIWHSFSVGFSPFPLLSNGSAYNFGLQSLNVNTPGRIKLSWAPDTFDTGSNLVPRSAWALVEMETAGATTGTYTMYINGSTAATNAMTVAPINGIYMLGSQGTGDTSFAGRVADFQVYDISGGSISAPDLASIRAYYADRITALNAAGGT